MACELTIWTDFEVSNTKRYKYTCDAIIAGDDALLNLGCDRYSLELDNGSERIMRRRVYRPSGHYDSPWVVETL